MDPVTAFWNKDYSTTDKGSKLKHILIQLHNNLGNALGLSEKNSYADNGVYFADDCLIVLRNLGFLEDPTFIKAVGIRTKESYLMGRLWRLWFISWSLSTQWPKNGIILDLGTYNGKAMFSACKYASLKHPDLSLAAQKLILADLFEDPPAEAKKADHSSNLHLDVEQLFRAFSNTTVAKGFIPQSIDSADFSQGIKWCQIDLNSADSDLKAFNFIYDKLLPGSHVIFDDYGFSRYKETQIALDNFLKGKRETIFELPTGQGFLIKSH